MPMLPAGSPASSLMLAFARHVGLGLSR
ncbi:MAG: hypothetical protein QOJ51_3119, partial [Acidobacteriaceae bacterium]|nr:hypothetical protein [Acidobacteriaceae bacterium]